MPGMQGNWARNVCKITAAAAVRGRFMFQETNPVLDAKRNETLGFVLKTDKRVATLLCF